MTYISDDFFTYANEDGTAIPLGACQEFAGFLDKNPAASVRGVEENIDDTGLDVVIGVENTNIARVSAEFLLGAQALTKFNIPGQSEQLRGLVDRTNALIGTGNPIPIIRPYGSL